MIKDYIKKEILGKGSYGIVYKVQQKNTNNFYVIKQIFLNKLSEKELNLVSQEAKVLSLINSDFVVKYIDYFEENDIINIVMEYCDGGDLLHYLKSEKKSGKFLDEDLIWQIFIKITIGLADIHKNRILHRDIKSLNIFLKKNLDIKIGDLGVAKILSNADYTNTCVGTQKYKSPEIISGKPYNDKTDVWSLGCVLYELCSFKLPFGGEKDPLRSDPDPIDGHYSSDLSNLLFSLLNKNPEKRPSCIEILSNDKVLNKIKYFGLYKYIIKLNDNRMNNANAQTYINENIYKSIINSKSQNLYNNNNNVMNFGSNINDFIDLSILEYGKRCSATIKKMQSKINCLYYAIKIIPKNRIVNKKDIFREKIIQSSINHKNIVRQYGNFEDSENYYLVLEYLANDNLEEKIGKHIKSFVNQNIEFIQENIVINIFKQILNGVEYLHSIGVVHRNIKPDNILFDEFNNVKLADFGLSACLKSKSEQVFFDPNLLSNHTRVGHKDYTAPEVINGFDYDSKCDIFSLGITIFYLMTFQLPFYSYTNNENKLIRNQLNVNLSNIYSNGLKTLVYKMISENPNDRPTAKEVKEMLIQIENSYNQIKIANNNNINCNKYDISSLTSIITCICEIDDLDFPKIKNMITDRINNPETLKNFLPINVIDMKEVIEQNKNFIINKFVCDEYFYKLKFLLSSKSNKINLIGETEPVILFQELIQIFSKEFKENMPFDNLLFQKSNLIIKETIPNLVTTKIEETIRENFQLNYSSPFVDIFYFINTNLIKCPFCSCVIDFSNNILFSISIQTDKNQNLENLLKRYFNQQISNYTVTCPDCNLNNLIEERFFVNSPQYLIIEFENKNENNITLDDTIDLSPYILTNLGPRKFEFFAVISEEKMNGKKHYFLGIKKNTNYFFYSDNNYQKSGEEIKKYGNPHIVIYKGQKNN